MNAYRQDYTALVGQAGEQVNGIYEADYRDFNRDTYVRGRETFDRTYAEFKELLIGCWWRDGRNSTIVDYDSAESRPRKHGHNLEG